MKECVLFLLLAFAAYCVVVGVAVRREDSSDESLSSSVPLCGPDVMADARLALGDETKENLMEVLAMNSTQLDDLLGAISIRHDEFSVEDLCEQAVAHIPDILEVAVPPRNDESCITPNCSETTSTSSHDLAQSIKESSEEVEAEQLTSHQEPVESNEAVAEDHEPTRAELLRRLLAVLFRVFPALDAEVEIDSSSLLESEGAPVFGSRVQNDLRTDIAKIYQMAVAIVAGTLRKLNQATTQIEKWFKVHGDAVQQQRTTLRKHLSLILGALGRSMLKYDPACRYVAYIMAAHGFWNWLFGCNVQDFRDCGIKQSGRYVVNACPPFMKSVPKSSLHAFAAQILIHEHSHHFGSKDKCYQPCIGHNSSDLVINADSYAAFCTDVNRGTSSGDCQDTDMICAYYKSQNLCGVSDYMKHACKKTCGLCR
eukprot:TRINITY_DN17916_c0_g2_i1.p1 TRINITY_DN17916_c0_g2~~TRINITY_DN17916_c0_g2_i1.p1  ORF type:complete len:426 (+),score=57.31 TRINITY_DN17916_c0_g2_i1:93-1370(+)